MSENCTKLLVYSMVLVAIVRRSLPRFGRYVQPDRTFDLRHTRFSEQSHEEHVRKQSRMSFAEAQALINDSDELTDLPLKDVIQGDSIVVSRGREDFNELSLLVRYNGTGYLCYAEPRGTPA